MNYDTYLLMKDIDDHIIAYIDPPAILTLTEVNKYYNNKLRKQRHEMNKARGVFMRACCEGYLWIAKWIVNRDQINHIITNIHAKDDRCFYLACKNNHIEIVKWLLELSNGLHGNINIHKKGGICIKYACENNNLELAKLLIDLEVKTGKKYFKSAICDSFYYIYENGDMEFMEWATTITNFNIANKFSEFCKSGHTKQINGALKFINEKSLKITIRDINFFRTVVQYNDMDMVKKLIQLNNEGILSFQIDYHDVFEYLLIKNSCSKMIQFFELTEELNNPIDIHHKDDYYFSSALNMKELDKAKYLISLGEKYYDRFNIHVRDEEYFRNMCEIKNSIESLLINLQWLIDLGEKGYGKIDIHVRNEECFRKLFKMLNCRYYHNELKLAIDWFINLGENGYGKINIHANNEEAFIYSCLCGDISFAQKIINMEQHGYGQTNIHIDNEVIFRGLCKYKQETALIWLIELEKTHGLINPAIKSRYLSELHSKGIVIPVPNYKIPYLIC